MRLPRLLESLFSKSESNHFTSNNYTTNRKPDLPASEIKASRTMKLAALTKQGQARWTPRDYAALAREGYSKNPVVYRCVRMISEAAASLPLTLVKGRDELQQHPLLELLQQPSQGTTAASFWEAVYGNLLTAGNAYIEQVSLNATPRELHVLRPDRIKVVTDKNGWVSAWDYQLAGRSMRIATQLDAPIAPLLHIKMFHPLNDHYGFAPLEAALLALDSHNAAATWNKALLDNAACPTGALVYGGSEVMNLTEDQFQSLKAELEGSYQGARNAGRPLLLEGGLEWRPMGLSPKDLEFTAVKNQAAREIALAFGIPPMVLGIPGDNTYATYSEANRAFWRQCVIPLVRRCTSELACWLAPAYGESLRLAPNLDAIEALSSERANLWQRINAADFLTDNEKRHAVGYAPHPSP
ncbi:phage portal protein [Polycladidibacter stylochi]|uniref:phage portal protein n=1 Tax=Polycladidibacter stylochi TaxID=1807766 RepID=UPI0009EAB93C|nr:phage portal protein [Pseudovibrio stylochi]